MHFPYEPFILRRMTEGRIFFTSPKMPFELFLNCFWTEKPFFLVSQLEDGRIAITPNAFCVPHNFFEAGPHEFLPKDYEYVTIKNGTYPVIITAHPVQMVDEWLRKFDMWVKPWLTQTLQEFVALSGDFQPLKPLGKQPIVKEQRFQEPIHT